MAVGLGKEALETAESISGFAWDVCKWLGRVGKYGVTHPGESIDQMGEWSWEALQWSIYALEHPGEALAFSAEVFKQSKEPVVSWAKTEWGRITVDFEGVFGGGGEDPYRAGLSAGKLIWDATMLASIGSAAKGVVVKGGKALLTTAVDRGLIKGAGALSAVEKTRLVTTAERVGSEVAKSGELKSELHHFLSDKHKTRFTKDFEDITGKYGLKLKDDWNTRKIPGHKGRHATEYHKWALKKLGDINRQASGNKDEFLRLFEERIVKKVERNPEMLKKAYWIDKQRGIK